MKKDILLFRSSNDKSALGQASKLIVALLVLLLISPRLMAQYHKLIQSSDYDIVQLNSIMCRNHSNTHDIVLQTGLGHQIMGPNSKHLITLMELDNTGTIIIENTIEWSPPISGYINYLKLQKIIPGANNEYFVLGQASIQGTPANSLNSYMLVLDNNLNIIKSHFFPSTVLYFDIELTTNKNYMVLGGMAHSSSNVSTSSREGVIASYDVNTLLPVPSSTLTFGNTSLPAFFDGRYENIKTLEIYNDGTTDQIVMAGNYTEFKDLSPNPIGGINEPRVYAHKVSISNTGVINPAFSWSQILNLTLNGKVLDRNKIIPADLAIDKNNNRVVIVGSLPEYYGLEQASLWELDLTNGSGVNFIAFEGHPGNDYDLHNIHPYTIDLENSGEFRISGWAPEYRFDFPPPNLIQTGKYNFWSAKYSSITGYLTDLDSYFMNSQTYLPGAGTPAEFIDYSTTIPFGITPSAGKSPFHTPEFCTTYKSGGQWYTSFAWLKTTDISSIHKLVVLNQDNCVKMPVPIIDQLSPSMPTQSLYKYLILSPSEFVPGPTSTSTVTNEWVIDDCMYQNPEDRRPIFPGQIETGNSDISIITYPNPTREVINMELKGEQKITNVKIFNSLGEVVFEKVWGDDNTIQINVENWSKGLYIVSVEGNEFKQFYEKIIIN